MAKIVGKYVVEKTENCDSFLATALPEARSIANLQATIEFVQHAKTIYEMTYQLPNKTITTIFKLGVTFLDEIITGHVFQSVAALEGNILKFKSMNNGQDYGGRNYEFTKDSLTVTVTAPVTQVQAIRYYKRVE